MQRSGRWSYGLGAVGLAVGLALAAAAATSATETLTVREQLNQAYGPELVVYPFAAQDGACVADSVRLAGPEGRVAAQLADIEYWPGNKGYVKSARLHFVVANLKPLASVPYTLTFDQKSGTAAVTTDLLVKPTKDCVEITTSKVGVRLPLGRNSFPEP